MSDQGDDQGNLTPPLEEPEDPVPSLPGPSSPRLVFPPSTHTPVGSIAWPKSIVANLIQRRQEERAEEQRRERLRHLSPSPPHTSADLQPTEINLKKITFLQIDPKAEREKIIYRRIETARKRKESADRHLQEEKKKV
jgi:hypothetical protein